MCVSWKTVKNPYTGKVLKKPCGHCPACLQAKSDKAYSKVRSHVEDADLFTVFLTLNYSNQFLPFIQLPDDETEFFNSPTFPVYRLNTIRRVRVKTSTGFCYRAVPVNKISKICDLPFSSRLDCNINSLDFDHTYQPVNFPFFGRIVGVCISKDFSDFIKRFRVNLQRDYKRYNISDNDYEQLLKLFSFYRVSEYGPSTQRPHFHAELHFPRSAQKYYNFIRRTVIKSWPFCNFSQWKTNIGIARNAAAYVTSYTTRPSDLPNFFNLSKIRPRASHSRDYGFGSRYFRPSSILEQVKQGTFGYYVSSITKDKQPIRLDLPLPQFVTRRYFPKIKGFRFLTDDEIFCCLQKPILINDYVSKLCYSPEDVHRFLNTVYRCSSRLSLSYPDYAYYYLRYYQNMRHRYCSDLYSQISNPDDLKYFYYNALQATFYKYPPLDIHNLLDRDLSDFNGFPCNTLVTERLTQKYCTHVKKAKDNDYIISLHTQHLLTQNLNYGKFKEKTVYQGEFAETRT